MRKKILAAGIALAGLVVVSAGICLLACKPKATPDPALHAALDPAFRSQDVLSPFTVSRLELPWKTGWLIEFQPAEAAKQNHGRKEVLLLPLVIAGHRAAAGSPGADWIEIRSVNLDEDVVRARADVEQIRRFIAEEQKLETLSDSVDFEVIPWKPDASGNQEMAKQYLARGEILNEKNLDAKALALFEKALALVPDNSDVHYCIGRTSLKLGDHSKAMEHLESAIRIDPNNFKVYPLLAAFHIDSNRPDAAIPLLQTFERIHSAGQLSSDPYYKWALLRTAYCFWNLNQPVKAKAYATECIQLDPREPYAHYLMGRICGMLNDRRGMAVSFKNFAALESNDGHQWRMAGHAFVDLKDYASAIRAFRQSYTLGERDVGIFMGLGHCYYVTGQFFDAKHATIEGLKRYPGNADLEKNFRAIHWNIVKKRLKPKAPPTPIELAKG